MTGSFDDLRKTLHDLHDHQDQGEAWYISEGVMRSGLQAVDFLEFMNGPVPRLLPNDDCIVFVWQTPADRVYLSVSDDCAAFSSIYPLKAGKKATEVEKPELVSRTKSLMIGRLRLNGVTRRVTDTANSLGLKVEIRNGVGHFLEQELLFKVTGPLDIIKKLWKSVGY